MNLDKALTQLNVLERDIDIQKMVAQARSRYVLFNVEMSKEDIPPYYTIIDENLNLLAFTYLNIACNIYDKKKDEANIPFEKGASILEYVHKPTKNRTAKSNYYLIASSLSYYACYQYSKSFVLIDSISENTVIANLIYLFLKRDFITLKRLIHSILLNEKYKDDWIFKSLLNKIINFDEADERVYIRTIALSIDKVLLFFYTGNERLLTEAIFILTNLVELLSLNEEPATWWIVRLLKIIFEGYEDSSNWKVLKKYFGLNTIENYVKALVYSQSMPITELFISQRYALNKVLDEKRTGVVVSMPTSSGKTRVAEVSILQSLTKNQNSKVLYLAPFKSLAFEVESNLKNIFERCGFKVTQLYGDNQFSVLDAKLIEDSNIIIATPEKAKAFIRANKSLIDNIKLIIIDEGHLIGREGRHIKNEAFYEELIYRMMKQDGRIILLSAVLPNTNHIAEWISGRPDNFYTTDWRPATERLGVAVWNGNHININWEGTDEEKDYYNIKFVTQKEIIKNKKSYLYPSTFQEAIAQTSIKFSKYGSVLIFVGLKDSVYTHARAILEGLGKDVKKYIWKNTKHWLTFKQACIDAFGQQSEWLYFAEYGIICHNSNLPDEIRVYAEKLIKESKPPFIVATSTLGQGVNLGVSTVIFSTYYQAGQRLTFRDFWNISGRAGRAFVDSDGKVLIAVDRSIKDKNNFKPIIKKKNPEGWKLQYKQYLKDRNWRIRTDKKICQEYFDKLHMEQAESGLLSLVHVIKNLCEKQKISFDLLLALILENKFDLFNEEQAEINKIFDFLDDTLLSMIFDSNSEESVTIDFKSVEEQIRRFLAYIQAKNDAVVSQVELHFILISRARGLINKIGHDRKYWSTLINSGLPLSSGIAVIEIIPLIKIFIYNYSLTQKKYEDLFHLIQTIEEVVHALPVIQDSCEAIRINNNQINEIRDLWLNGSDYKLIYNLKYGEKLVNRYFKYSLPWVLNAISKSFKAIQDESASILMEELAILAELGLPSIHSANFFILGIRSRPACIELASLLTNEDSKEIEWYMSFLILNYNNIKLKSSENTLYWVDLFLENKKNRFVRVKLIPSFRLDEASNFGKVLVPAIYNKEYYLCSADYNYKIEAKRLNIDLSNIANTVGIEFVYNEASGLWDMKIHNPYIQPT